MSWALEAIEKAALERARVEFVKNPGAVRVMGMNLATISALHSFAYATLGMAPSALLPEELVRRLQAQLK